MKYLLIQKLLDAAPPLESSETEFEAIVASRSCGNHALAIEEKYSLVLRNYFEVEREIHRLNLESITTKTITAGMLLDGIRDVNRVLMNLMSAQRTYVDHVPQHLNDICGANSVEAEGFKTKTSEEFDSCLGYKVTTGLRNHAQHSGFPVHFLSLESKWREEEHPRICDHLVRAQFLRDDIVGNMKVGALVRTAIAKMPEKVDVIPLVRESMSSFARLHLHVRETLLSRVNESDRRLEAAYEKFEKHAERKPVGLNVIRIDDTGNEIGGCTIALLGRDRRKHLEEQSGVLVNMERHSLCSHSFV